MPILLVRNGPCRRLEVCSGVRETNEPCFRPGSLVPSGDWRTIDSADGMTGWDRYEGGKCLHGNVGLVRVIDARALLEAERKQLEPFGENPDCDPIGNDTWRMALKLLDGVCGRLCEDTPLDHKGRWLAKGGGVSQSTTRDRSDGKLTGLHIDRWERRPLESLSSARNRVCLNMGPGPRWLVFMAIGLQEMAAHCAIEPPISFTTAHAQMYLRQHPLTPVYRLRIEPGEAYVASTESLIHDGQASSADGEWVYTVFGRFERTEEARSLSVV